MTIAVLLQLELGLPPEVHPDDSEVRHGERAGVSAGARQGARAREEDGAAASKVGNEVRGHH